jgi:hypothetical protein
MMQNIENVELLPQRLLHLVLEIQLEHEPK